MEMQRKVNDVHIHVGDSSIINQKMSPDEIPHYREKLGIDHLMIFSLDVDIEENNQKVIELSKNNDFIHGLIWVQHSRIDDDVEILKNELGRGIVGVKFHGVFENKPVSDVVYEPILNVLNEKSAILLIHCGRFKDGSPESNSSYVHALDVAKKFPNIKVILAHMGGNDTSVVKKAITAAKDIPNAFFDTSGISTPYRVEYAVEQIGPERILFGSDFPWCSFRSMYWGVEDALISEDDKELIFVKNFLKLVSKL